MAEPENSASTSENIGFTASKKICIGVMIGLPASGKSTLCHILEEMFLTEPSVHILRLSFDDIVSINVQKGFLEAPDSAKTLRRNFIASLQMIIEKIRDDDIDLASYSKSDSSTYFEDDALVDKESFVNYAIKCHQTISKSCSQVVILIDDNNYYKSMRKEYFNVAKSSCISFISLFCDTPVEECIQRNSKRTAEYFVPPDAIQRMEKKLEVPNPMENEFDSCCISLKGEINLELLKLLIQQSFKSPLKPKENHSEIAQRDKRICSENEFHQADIILRKWINLELFMNRSANSPKCSTKNLAKELCRKKSMVLNQLRQGNLKVTNELDQPLLFRDEIINLLKNCDS